MNKKENSYSISPPLNKPITFIGSDMNGKLNPCIELPLHFSCLALHFVLSILEPLQDVQFPIQSGATNVTEMQLSTRNL